MIVQFDRTLSLSERVDMKREFNLVATGNDRALVAGDVNPVAMSKQMRIQFDIGVRFEIVRPGDEIIIAQRRYRYFNGTWAVASADVTPRNAASLALVTARLQYHTGVGDKQAASRCLDELRAKIKDICP